MISQLNNSYSKAISPGDDQAGVGAAPCAPPVAPVLQAPLVNISLPSDVHIHGPPYSAPLPRPAGAALADPHRWLQQVLLPDNLSSLCKEEAQTSDPEEPGDPDTPSAALQIPANECPVLGNDASGSGDDEARAASGEAEGSEPANGASSEKSEATAESSKGVSSPSYSDNEVLLPLDHFAPLIRALAGSPSTSLYNSFYNLFSQILGPVRCFRICALSTFAKAALDDGSIWRTYLVKDSYLHAHSAAPRILALPHVQPILAEAADEHPIWASAGRPKRIAYNSAYYIPTEQLDEHRSVYDVCRFARSGQPVVTPQPGAQLRDALYTPNESLQDYPGTASTLHPIRLGLCEDAAARVDSKDWYGMAKTRMHCFSKFYTSSDVRVIPIMDRPKVHDMFAANAVTGTSHFGHQTSTAFEDKIFCACTDGRVRVFSIPEIHAGVSMIPSRRTRENEKGLPRGSRYASFWHFPMTTLHAHHTRVTSLAAIPWGGHRGLGTLATVDVEGQLLFWNYVKKGETIDTMMVDFIYPEREQFSNSHAGSWNASKGVQSSVVDCNFLSFLSDAPEILMIGGAQIGLYSHTEQRMKHVFATPGVSLRKFDEDGGVIAASNSTSTPVQLWDAATAHKLGQVQGTSYTSCIQLLADRRMLAIGTHQSDEQESEAQTPPPQIKLIDLRIGDRSAIQATRVFSNGPMLSRCRRSFFVPSGAIGVHEENKTHFLSMLTHQTLIPRFVGHAGFAQVAARCTRIINKLDTPSLFNSVTALSVDDMRIISGHANSMVRVFDTRMMPSPEGAATRRSCISEFNLKENEKFGQISQITFTGEIMLVASESSTKSLVAFV